MDELNKIIKRYELRENNSKTLWQPMKLYNLHIKQERDRLLAKFIRKSIGIEIDNIRVLDIGCGEGLNIKQLIQFGFNPELITGVDILSEKINIASSQLPSSITLLNEDITSLNLIKNSFDLIIIFVVYSSVLDDNFQKEIAQKSQELLTDNGVIIVYDFGYNNPRNKDVRKITFKHIKSLYPSTKIEAKKLTLAPPIGRLFRSSQTALTILSCIPFLRTHTLYLINPNG